MTGMGEKAPLSQNGLHSISRLMCHPPDISLLRNSSHIGIASPVLWRHCGEGRRKGWCSRPQEEALDPHLRLSAAPAYLFRNLDVSALEEWSVPSQALYDVCYLLSPAKVMSEPSHLLGPFCSFRQHIKELAQQHQSQQFHPSQLCCITQTCKFVCLN